MKLLRDPERICYREYQEHKLIVERGDVIVALKETHVYDHNCDHIGRLGDDTHLIFLESAKEGKTWFKLFTLSPEGTIYVFYIDNIDEHNQKIIPLELFNNPSNYWKYNSDLRGFYFETPLRYE